MALEELLDGVVGIFHKHPVLLVQQNSGENVEVAGGLQ
jgi:hypothetical protein